MRKKCPIAVLESNKTFTLGQIMCQRANEFGRKEGNFKSGQQKQKLICKKP